MNYRIGRFLLDTLTNGMYENPLCVLREYIQNCADAIDSLAAKEGKSRTKYEIQVAIDPRHRSLTILDNGCGVSADISERTLVSVGDSEKFGNRERGFRGIGRLGGVAYCDKLCFRTKAAGEKIETVCVWACDRIRQLLSPSNRSARTLELKDLIDSCVTVEKTKTTEATAQSMFCVHMENVHCSKNILLDFRAVRHYLSQVAPVPFDAMKFAYGEELDSWLNRLVPNFNTYRLFVNDEEVLKPYTQTVAARHGATDEITGILKYEITDSDGKVIGHGWRGIRRDNLTQLRSDDGIDAIRVRIGNIQLGDHNLLNDAFPESRFNRYNIGEIHVIDPGLLPNARRDNFEDSELKTAFFNSVERDVAVPLVKLIRHNSKAQADRRPVKAADDLILKVKSQTDKGFVSNGHKKELLKDLRETRADLGKLQAKRSVSDEARQEAASRVAKIDSIATALGDMKPDITGSLAGMYSQKERELIQLVLEQVFDLHPKFAERSKLIDKVVIALGRVRT
jgi:hypothetical protein